MVAKKKVLDVVRHIVDSDRIEVLLETPQCGLGVRHDNTTAVSPLASARVSRTRRCGHAHRASAGARATTRALRTHCYAHRDCF